MNRNTAADFHEDDEDPAEVWAAFRRGEPVEVVPGRPMVRRTGGLSVTIPSNCRVADSTLAADSSAHGISVPSDIGHVTVVGNVFEPGGDGDQSPQDR